MIPLIGAFSLVVVALISGWVSLAVARRSKSGNIDTSEAATLWDEGSKMRGELRDEVVVLKTQLIDAIAAIKDLNTEIKAARAETEASREETRQSRAETRILMSQIEQLHGEIETSNSLSIGSLADNTETRRILLLPKKDRSSVEILHLATAGGRQPQSDRPVIDVNDKPTEIEIFEATEDSDIEKRIEFEATLAAAHEMTERLRNDREGPGKKG